MAAIKDVKCLLWLVGRRFLKPGGAILPDLASIIIAGGSRASSGPEFWADVYGFSMGPIHNAVQGSCWRTAVVKVRPSHCSAVLGVAWSIHAVHGCMHRISPASPVAWHYSSPHSDPK